MVQALARVPPSVSTVNTLSDSCPLPAGSTVLGFLRALCQVVHITYRVDGDGFFQGALSGGSCPLSTGSNGAGFSQGALSRCTKKGLQSGSANAAIFFSGRTFSNLMSRVGRTLIIHRI